ncbi:LLM class flavin-dependent oxidoreductase [Micromonospora sp. CPCC 206060]|uniref:LLM class flavin-dependent oxidoreductase n=1 Tax=Micromonospora sp. CPCC 206060 TaxID=3122406 RepID=UPI002FF22C5D
MKVSVLYPGQPESPSAVAPYAQFVRRDEAARLWLGQSLRAEPHQVAAYLAGSGSAVPVGTSVTLMPLRGAYEAALQARSLAVLTGHPYVAGFGASTPDVVRALTGRPYDRPASALGDYLSTIRSLLRDETVNGMRLAPLRHPGVEVGAGVLRPGMARVAGATADVAVTWMTSPEYLRTVVVPALRAGAGDDRPVPRIVTVAHVATSRPDRNPERLAYLAAGQHLRAAHYVDMLCRAGLSVSTSDPRGGARALVGSGLFTYDAPDGIVERLAAYAAAGVDELVLNPCGVLLAEGEQAAVDDIAAILKAWEA